MYCLCTTLLAVVMKIVMRFRNVPRVPIIQKYHELAAQKFSKNHINGRMLKEPQLYQAVEADICVFISSTVSQGLLSTAALRGMTSKSYETVL